MVGFGNVWNRNSGLLKGLCLAGNKSASTDMDVSFTYW